VCVGRGARRAWAGAVGAARRNGGAGTEAAMAIAPTRMPWQQSCDAGFPAMGSDWEKGESRQRLGLGEGEVPWGLIPGRGEPRHYRCADSITSCPGRTARSSCNRLTAKRGRPN
jgi:hypothetical protein